MKILVFVLFDERHEVGQIVYSETMDNAVKQMIGSAYINDLFVIQFGKLNRCVLSVTVYVCTVCVCA